jgi:hypothetical protein
MKKNKEKRYKLELSESQLHLVAYCVEDLHRFMSGQMELFNCTSMLDNCLEVQDKLQECYQLVVPDLYNRYHYGASYPWSGGNCPNKRQHKFLAESYYLYREIYHQLTIQERSDDWSVYNSETLRCKESGSPIKLTLIIE